MALHHLIVGDRESQWYSAKQLVSDVSMCHTQHFCGWDIAYIRLRLPRTIHVCANHTGTGLAHSPQTLNSWNRWRPSTKTITKTPGRHNARIPAQTMLNRLRRFTLTLSVRRPYLASSWIGSGMMQGSTGWWIALIDVPSIWNRIYYSKYLW